jgi:flagellum-specific ATP synthase
VLSRALANRNHYPAIDILASISRVMPDVVTDTHKKTAAEIKKVLAVYRDAEDLINIGAYTRGSNEKIDFAIDVFDNIQNFTEQSVGEKFTYDEIMEIMDGVLMSKGT